jgi:membrane protease YdiL (CAAX protease family)
MSIFGMGSDPTSLLQNMTPGFLIFLLITTILFQWAIFLLNYGAVYTERTGLIGVGLKRIRALDFAWAAAFLAAANLLLAGLAWLLAQIGLPMSGEIQFLIPEDATGRVVWVLVSFTAGFCEEVGFRGYLMTRLRLVGRFQSWLVPTIVSALIFGACHAYQGWPGFIILSVYGAMFSLLYIRTGSLWPCVIAHSLQDLGALFFPQ